MAMPRSLFTFFALSLPSAFVDIMAAFESGLQNSVLGRLAAKNLSIQIGR